MRVPLLLAALLLAPAGSSPMDLAKALQEAVRKVNEEHAEKPGKAKEDDLAARLPKDARKALDALLAAKDGPDLPPALLVAAGAALDLDLEEDFERIRARLEKSFPGEAKKAGLLVSRPRFMLLGRDGVTRPYLEHLAGVVQGIFESYDRVFGFEEFSKVPGKKVRFRIRLVERITAPPHFAPQFEFHSQVDVPVLAEERLTSPTKAGQFQFYGLCHELGHVVAMMDREEKPEDFHQWADYTGNAIVEELSTRKPAPEWMEGLKDFPRWKGLETLRRKTKEVQMHLGNPSGVLKMLVSLHDTVGPRAIGDAINLLDRKDERLRVNRVRYYTFAEIRAALLEVVKDAEKRKSVEALLPD
jgi:hypothetical protein